MINVIKIESSVYESNTYIVTKGKQAIIIDCGADYEEIISSINGYKVKAIFLTHGHFDHAFHALRYAKEFGAKIYANENAKEILIDPQKNYGGYFKIEDFSEFIFIKGDGKLKIGNFVINYFWTPGHSKCSTSYLIENELFAGDFLFRDGIGRTDLYGSDQSQMLESLKKASQWEFNNCHSGHYEIADYARMKRNIAVYIRFLSKKLEEK